MAYNKINKLKRYKNIQEITLKHYTPGYTTLKGVWNMYIYPVYLISYAHYLRILGEPALNERIQEAEEKKCGKQMEFF